MTYWLNSTRIVKRRITRTFPVLGAVLLALGVAAWPSKAVAESYLRQPFSKTAEELEVIGFGRLVKVLTVPDGIPTGEFEITEILKGDKLVRVGQKVTCSIGKERIGDEVCLARTNPPDSYWEDLGVATERLKIYTRQLLKVRAEAKDRAKCLLPFMEDQDKDVAYEVGMELEAIPYASLQEMKPGLQRGQLWAWIRDEKIPARRRRQYLRLLSICGTPQDAALLETMLKEPARQLLKQGPTTDTDLHELVACYLSLQGKSGLSLVSDLFISNKQASYKSTYFAVVGLRTYTNERCMAAPENARAAVRQVLDRPEFADLVIPDLAAWEDWSVKDKLFELFQDAKDNETYKRIPVVNYLRKCPLPEAKVHLAECERIDPKACELATKYSIIKRP